jgi:hypothetical protein
MSKTLVDRVSDLSPKDNLVSIREGRGSRTPRLGKREDRIPFMRRRR